VRALDLSFQREIDTEVEALLALWQPPVMRLKPADRDRWVEQVVTALGLPLVPPQADLFDEEAGDEAPVAEE
jgi:hypothetical protein